MPPAPLSLSEVLRHAAGWSWLPDGGTQERDDLLLVHYPPRFGSGVKAHQVDSRAPASTVVDRAVSWARARNESTVRFTVSDTDHPNIEDELLGRGALHSDTTTVFARPLAGPAVPVPATALGAGGSPMPLTAEIVRSRRQIEDVDAVEAAVWGQEPISDAAADEELLRTSENLSHATGARALARVGGHPASTGGCTIVDGVVRLWGAATLPRFRGMGAYRAVLAERMRHGLSVGAHTAVVKGRVPTSAGTLSRCGFDVYSEEREYTLTLH
ncbi:MAG: hypothetical protein ACTH1D_00335 [Mycobacteriaceae bacterium]|uniref:hypothetical protein n=1 Tax=Corynebacterium sp. TaxID=1720 RepID=UPI003F9C8BAD